MVSSKARQIPRPYPLEEPRTSKNSAKDFRIYSTSTSDRAKGLTGAVEWGGDSSRNSARNALPAMSRRSMPAGSLAKPAAATGRKALADVSNGTNLISSQLRNRPSYNPKPMKDKLEGSTAVKGKINSLKSPRALSMNKENLRISLAKSVVVANSSLRRSTGGKVLGKENNLGKCDSSVRTGRKTLAVINNTSNEMSCHLRNRLSNTSKPMKDKLESSLLVQGNSNRVKIPCGPRISLTRSVMVPNASSNKPHGTKSKIKRTSMVKHTSSMDKPATTNSSEKKEAEVLERSGRDDTASVPDQGCGSRPSNETVTAIISRPKCKRRRSYTSSLMAGTKILGGEHADLAKKDELSYIDDSANPLEVAEYVDDIYQYYWTMEALNPSLANYMSIQTEITPRMRGILVNWLIEVHLKFDLMQETLFLMIELLDRVLSLVSIKKNDLQMVGLTALLLASKYEDFWHPKIDDLISISVNAFTREQMLAMERVILTKLRYRLNTPTPYVFMLRFLKAAQSDRKLEHLAYYLIELCLLEYQALKFKPSLLCASAIYVARCTLHMEPAWTSLLTRHAHYEESQLRDSAEMVLRFQRAAGGLKPAKITYEKFLSPDRGRVAAIDPLEKLPL